ncbi:MAG TPA: hypothetical protein VKJ07_21795, partial [Mycobacteriales bacterium]|nr:hypothetical protein [Mycobacteriales bacterium]
GFHNLLQRPRDVPVRTALGVMALTFYGVLFIGGQNDILARTFDWSLQATSWTLRVLLIVAPPIAFYITKRWCLGLQHHDEELLHHGIETGIIRRLPSGEYIEVTAPLPPQRAAVLAMQLGVDHDGHANGHALPSGNGHIAGEPEATKLRRPVGPVNRARNMLEGFFFERSDAPRANPEDDEPKTLSH